MAYSPDDPYEAAESAFGILQDLLNRANLTAAGEAIDKSKLGGTLIWNRVLLEDIYSQMPTDDEDDPGYAKIRTLVDDICEDWEKKCKISMSRIPREKMSMYLNRIESLSSDFIIKRDLNADSGYGQWYMGKKIKDVVSNLRKFAPAYDSGLSHV